MSNLAELLTAIGQVIAAVGWPLVILTIALMFAKEIRKVLGSEDLSFSGPGFSVNAKRRAVVATDAIVDAGSSSGEVISRDEAVVEVNNAQRKLKGAKPPLLLWVDDHPSNNRYERDAMEALGMNFILSLSTEDALGKLRETEFDAVISDMGRPPDARAGYTLLDEMRARNDLTPFVIYAGSRSPEHFDESIRHGAVGCTNRANELIAMVADTIKFSQSNGRS